MMGVAVTSRCFALGVPVACLGLLLGCPGGKGGNQPGSGSAKSSAAAGEAEKRKQDPDRNLVLATLAGGKITVGQLEDELNRQNPYIRMRFTSVERKREFLKNMVRFEVLAREARRKGLQNDPEVIKRVKRAMIDRMMEGLHTTLVKMDDITDAEIADYYAKNKQLYQQPAKARASMILCKTMADAQKVLAEAKKKSGDAGHFSALVKEHTIDDATKERRGDLDFFAADEARVPKEVRDAVFATTGLWSYAGPVKTERGFAVLMKTGELEAINRPVELEKVRIRNRLYNEKRMKALEKFVDDLQAKAKVQVNDANLAKVKVNTDTRPDHVGGHGHPGMGGMPGMPRPGMPGMPRPGMPGMPRPGMPQGHP
jgi:peptidyl-prolyl cis-trans isomerase C